MVGLDLLHAFSYVLGPETHENTFPRSFSTTFWWKEEIKNWLILSKYGGEDLTHAFLYVLRPEKRKCISQVFPHHIPIL